jgi:hypothetical protein
VNVPDEVETVRAWLVTNCDDDAVLEAFMAIYADYLTALGPR